MSTAQPSTGLPRTVAPALRRGFRRSALALALVSALAVVAACAGSQGPGTGERPGPIQAADPANPLEPAPLPQRTTLKVATTTLISSYGAVLVADELGEFDKENLDVEIQVLPGQDAQLLLNQGGLDVAITGLTPGVFNLASAGGENRAIFPAAGRTADSTQGWYANKKILGADGRLSGADLRGATVAGPGGNTASALGYFMQYVRADDPGIKPGDIEFENLPVPDAVTALRRGAVDVAYASAPYNDVLASDPCCVFMPGAIPSEPTAYYWFGPQLRTTDTQAGLAFVRALARTTRDHLQGDYLTTPAVLDALVTSLQTPADTLNKLEPSVFDPDYDMVEANLEVYQTYCFELGDTLQYSTPLRNDQVFDDRFVKAVSQAQ